MSEKKKPVENDIDEKELEKLKAAKEKDMVVK